jgi:hypothetical protein
VAKLFGPWGVLELQKLGLYERLSEKCAHNQPYVNTIGMGPVRDLRTTTPQRLSALTFYHPAMQEVVLDAARGALKSGAAAPRARFAPAHRRQFLLSAAVWFAI